MSFGTNLQFMRKMHNGMTQEELAEKLGVSRQTISKWEMDNTFPEMDKAIQLCELFNCKLDEMIKEDLDSCDEAYSNLRTETIEELHYARYVVISDQPEDDAMMHMTKWAEKNKIQNPKIVGWDFPFVSQEQKNVYHMHGYCAACFVSKDDHVDEHEIINQGSVRYAVITIKEPYINPFTTIPKGYQTLHKYIEVNGFSYACCKDVIECFEWEHEVDGVVYMEVYVAIK